MVLVAQALSAERCVRRYGVGRGSADERHFPGAARRQHERSSIARCFLFQRWNEGYGFGPWCMSVNSLTFFSLAAFLNPGQEHFFLYNKTKTTLLTKSFATVNNWLRQVALFNFLISACGKCKNSDRAILVFFLFSCPFFSAVILFVSITSFVCIEDLGRDEDIWCEA